MSIVLPAHFDAPAFESLLRELAGDWTREVDASPVKTATPGGTVSLLSLGTRHSGLPQSWVRHQLTPAGALMPPYHLFSESHLDQLTYLLGSVAVREPLHWLGFPEQEGELVLDSVAAVARNVFEHAGAPGWLAAWASPDGQLEVAVSDSGRGFRHSLARQLAERLGEHWSDGAALEEVFRTRVSRKVAPDRGTGLREVVERVRGWGGTISIWSGTARVSAGPQTGSEHTVDADLPSLAGSLVVLTLPSRV